jgi:hypothetical protein
MVNFMQRTLYLRAIIGRKSDNDTKSLTQSRSLRTVLEPEILAVAMIKIPRSEVTGIWAHEV